MKAIHKNIIRVTLITAIIYVLCTQKVSAQAVGINMDGSPPNANAILDVKSPGKNGKGLLIPRITFKQRTEPGEMGGLLDESGKLRGGAAQGLIIYQTDVRDGFYYNTSTGEIPNWVMIASVGNSQNNGQNGPSGGTGQQGVTGSTGASTAWLTGPAAPTGGQGNTNDFYLQQNNGLYYKKTTPTTWTQQGSLMGATGATGPVGGIGAQGATGATGPVGGIGPTGPAGTMGLGTAAGNTPYWNGTEWVLNSSNLFNNGANIGIGIATPTEKLDIAGALKFSGALKPDGNAGAAGQVLASAGASAPPVWVSAFTKNNLYIDYSTGGAITGTSFATVPGLNRSLTLKAGDRVLLYATGGMAANGTVYTSADIGFSVNQQDLMNGGYTKVSVDYAGSRFVPNANWTLMGHYDVATDGIYVFGVRTKQSSPSNGTATVGGDNTTVLQSTMFIQVLK